MHLLCVTKQLVFVCNLQLKTLMIKKKRKRNTALFLLDGLINGGGLYPGGLITGIIYSFEKGWAYIRGEGLKTGGGAL